MADTTTTKRTNYQGVKEDYTKLADELYNSYKQQGAEATQQAYALRRQQQQQAEQDFYNQLYDTNATVLDTIRRNNASAIATGASKGAAAANELSTILQGQQTSVDAATELAQSNYDLASEEANAYITAEQQAKQQAATDAINLAGNLAVAGQADAQIEAAQISADAAKYQVDNDYNKLKQALDTYTNPNSSEADRLAAAALVKSLTGDTVTNLSSTYGTSPEAPKNYVKDDDNPNNSKDLSRGYAGIMTAEQFGISDTDLYYRTDSRKSKTISYDTISNPELKKTFDEAAQGLVIKISDNYYVVDKLGGSKQLLRLVDEVTTRTTSYHKGLISYAKDNPEKVPSFSNV